MDIPLPWERLIWSGRPRRLTGRLAGVRFVLTDLRLARVTGARVDELALRDIGDVHRIESPLDRLLGTSTIVVDARRERLPSLVLAGVVGGTQVAALIELLAGDPRTALDADAIRDALAWEPQAASAGAREAVVGASLVVAAMLAVGVAVHGHPRPVVYSPDDPIAPNGEKRSRAEIVRFMDTDVMPWARSALGPVVGGPSHVTCETCHGRDPDARGWQMPAVAALPAPAFRDRGWERYSSAMDAQMRNAIYGYVAESEKQAKANYMREIVMPGMATLLGRPPYDFTRPYDENRARHAFGCYHCHRVR